MKRSSFKFGAAQYLFLNCPYISRNEWHPFTISSAPGTLHPTCLPGPRTFFSFLAVSLHIVMP
jgi:hypothetical protein